MNDSFEDHSPLSNWDIISWDIHHDVSPAEICVKILNMSNSNEDSDELGSADFAEVVYLARLYINGQGDSGRIWGRITGVIAQSSRNGGER
ncbi:hypothetical protein [Saccharothrix sp. HUAS TT1]|uniref:hypothetical protein n=1 Tax=unclassified Saccharothrix TaxID=2593673 RepID=UPI00345B5D9D